MLTRQPCYSRPDSRAMIALPRAAPATATFIGTRRPPLSSGPACANEAIRTGDHQGRARIASKSGDTSMKSGDTIPIVAKWEAFVEVPAWKDWHEQRSRPYFRKETLLARSINYPNHQDRYCVPGFLGRDGRLVKVAPLLAMAGDWNALLNSGVGCVKRTIISGPGKYGAFHAPYAAEPWAHGGGASRHAPAQPHRSAAREHPVCRVFGAHRGPRPNTQETRPKSQTTQTAKIGIVSPEFPSLST